MNKLKNRTAANLPQITPLLLPQKGSVPKRRMVQLPIPFYSFPGDKKREFLARLKSKDGKNKYKRYLGSPIRYGGGKSLAVGYIIEYLPDGIKRVISPFFGGGSVEIAIAKELDIPVLGFEIFDILVNYWQIQTKEPYKLYLKLALLEPTKEEYNRVKAKLKAYWKQEITLSPLELAAYYYFNHNLSYGPGFLGWMSKVYEDKNRYKIMIEKVCDFNVQNLWVECGSFENVLPKFRNDFLYCDPPYYLGDDSTLFRGIYPQRNFPIHHNNFDHEKLRDLLLNYHKAGFILSYNDCSTIRKWYSACKIVKVSWQYTMGQGETRIGLNRKKDNRNHVKTSNEILVIKYA